MRLLPVTASSPSLLASPTPQTQSYDTHWEEEIGFTCIPQARRGHAVLHFKADRVAAEPAEAPWKRPVMCDFPVQRPVISRSGHGTAPGAPPRQEDRRVLALVHLVPRLLSYGWERGLIIVCQPAPQSSSCAHWGPSPAKLCLPTPLLDSL